MASSKPQNLLVPLIVFVVLTVASGVTAFLFYQRSTKLQTELANANKAAQDANTKARTSADQVQTLRAKLGYPDAADFGTPNDAPGGTTLMSLVATDLTQYADPQTPASFSYKDELARLNQRKIDLTTELAAVTQDRDQLRLDYQKQRELEAAKIAEHEKKRQDAEADLAREQQAKEKQIAETERQRQEVATTAAQLANKEKQTAKDFELYRTRKDQQVNQLAISVNELKEGMQRVQSAGTPVGTVISVDYLNKQVYIDRGQADRLPLQTSFSVWSPDKTATLHWQDKAEKIKSDSDREFTESNKKTNLTPRLEGGPKAYIEVKEVLGPHQAVARITMNNIREPIVPGDLLYTPIWAPGQSKHFALVGKFDLSGKGTNDRALLVDMIKRQGGVIDAEVKEDGTIGGDLGDVGPGTHYLVVGTLPEELDSTDPNAKHAAAVRRAYDELRGRAKTLGVDVITQDKLYDFMGYRQFSRQHELGEYLGGPDPRNRFENPSNTTRPGDVPFENPTMNLRPSGIPGRPYEPR